MERVNLSYQTPKSGRITLYGLGLGAAAEIERVQADLGSSDFVREPYQYETLCPSCRVNHTPSQCARCGAEWRY